MKFTNKLNLPEPIFRAVCRDPYTRKSEFSATELQQPPRLRALKLKHEDELEEDAADRIWSLLGQIGHLILERAGAGTEESNIVERRFFKTFTEIDPPALLSGQADLVLDGDVADIVDYKYTSMYTVADGPKPEWIAQLNILKYLAEHGENEPLKIRNLTDVVIFNDWKKRKARHDPNYPQKQVQMLKIPVWNEQDTLDYILARMTMHRDALVNLPECSDADRWATPDVYAVKKPGGTRAVSGGIYLTMQEAMDRAAKDGLVWERRFGESVRCGQYCPCLSVCTQGQQRLMEEEKATME